MDWQFVLWVQHDYSVRFHIVRRLQCFGVWSLYLFLAIFLSPLFLFLLRTKKKYIYIYASPDGSLFNYSPMQLYTYKVCRRFYCYITARFDGEAGRRGKLVRYIDAGYGTGNNREIRFEGKPISGWGENGAEKCERISFLYVGLKTTQWDVWLDLELRINSPAAVSQLFLFLLTTGSIFICMLPLQHVLRFRSEDR